MAKTRVNKKTMRKRRTLRRRMRGGANNNNIQGSNNNVKNKVMSPAQKINSNNNNNNNNNNKYYYNNNNNNNNNNNSNVANNMDALTERLLEVAENDGLNETKQTDRLLKLIEKGADLLAESQDGMTILDIAIANGRKAQAFALMDVFDKSPVNNQGSIYNLTHDIWYEGGGAADQWLSYTPLMHAAKAGDIDIVKSLLQRGANILVDDGNYDTAADKARGDLKTMLQEIEKATKKRNSEPQKYQNILLRYGVRITPEAVQGRSKNIRQGEGGPGTNTYKNAPGSALGAGAGQ